jgi:hypothetical protein
VTEFLGGMVLDDVAHAVIAAGIVVLIALLASRK